jgi:hypothetical protein
MIVGITVNVINCAEGSVLVSVSLCDLSVFSVVPVVSFWHATFTTETQSSLRTHREVFNPGHPTEIDGPEFHDKPSNFFFVSQEGHVDD